MRVLVTSRAPLHVPGEQLLEVQPLPVPDLRTLPGPAELAAISSVALFAARVRASQPDFTVDADNARTIAEISWPSTGCRSPWSWRPRRYAATGWRRCWRVPGAGSRCGSRRSEASRTGIGPLPGPSNGVSRCWTRRPPRCSASCPSSPAGGPHPLPPKICGEPALDVPALLATLVDQSLVVAAETRSGLRYRMLETLREFAATQLDLHRERERFAAGTCRGVAGSGRR